MLVVRNALTGSAMAATTRFKALKTTTSAEAGFETLTVQVEAAAVSSQADKQWQGHEIVVFSREGTVWEGVIEQIQAASGYFNIFAVGMGLWELAAASLYGVYFDNDPKSWKEIPEDSLFHSKEGFTTNTEHGMIQLGAQKDKLINAGAQYGVWYLTPHAGADDYGYFRHLKLSYRRANEPTTGDDAGTAGLGGGFIFKVVGVSAAALETDLLTVNIDTTDVGSTTFTWDETTGDGFEQIWIMVKKDGTDGKVIDPDDTILVEVSLIELSIMDETPTIKSTIQHILGRLGKTYAHRPTEYPTAFLMAPLIADASPAAGMDVMRSLAERATAYTSEPYLFGVYEGYKFHLHNHAFNNYLITAADAGEDALYSLLRGAPAIGGQNDGVVTTVRAHYTDSVGVGRFTSYYPTGLRAPRPKIETIEASSEMNAEAEAEARAAVHAQKNVRGTFAVKGSISTLLGRQVPVSMVRAGDWITLSTVAISGQINRELLRGGMIGKTTYDYDLDEVSIELLGND